MFRSEDFILLVSELFKGFWKVEEFMCLGREWFRGEKVFRNGEGIEKWFINLDSVDLV